MRELAQFDHANHDCLAQSNDSEAGFVELVAVEDNKNLKFSDENNVLADTKMKRIGYSLTNYNLHDGNDLHYFLHDPSSELHQIIRLQLLV